MTEDKQGTQTGIRIYLDLPGLERLIGGNTEAEIEIREGIVRTFARKHLKELAGIQVFGPYLEKIRSAIEQEFRAQIPLILVESPSWKNQNQGVYRLQDGNPVIAAFKQRLAEEGREQLRPLCDAAFAEARKYIEEKFNRAVTELKARADETVEKHLGKAFETIVKLEVERRLKEIAKNLAAAQKDALDGRLPRS